MHESPAFGNSGGNLGPGTARSFRVPTRYERTTGRRAV